MFEAEINTLGIVKDLYIGGIILESIRLRVGCTKFPNMQDGQIGFAEKGKNQSLQPSYSYVNGAATGFVHTRNHAELSALTQQIGAMSKEQFMAHYRISPSSSWKNDYIRYLDKEIAEALLNNGIRLTISGKVVEFYTEPGYYEYTSIKPSKRFKQLYGEES